ncbi:hypothetical protein [Paenibacillus methanolicus]|uniref:Uncharacterized protein n=1 Tax=Paenibacillus methanolicus TaxID=582686 RepID=A0A5S5C3J5_9BACL|nr:hypothetical protein [Paenibacillus methanolicus]TYP73188.1 hypothetical protein BCM02_107172 [Paenibacillus methanolicus]
MTESNYKNWPTDEHARWIRMGHFFGKTLMEEVKGHAKERIDPASSVEERLAAEKAIRDTLYGFMMLLDGVIDSPIDQDHGVEFALVARVFNQDTREYLEEIELAPDGDGLCMGIHMWEDGEFE